MGSRSPPGRVDRSVDWLPNTPHRALKAVTTTTESMLSMPPALADG